ncbi:hypothetical protein [Novosphingobium sp.]|uniref:hypothetical protein n=1 Tax=Novosphingobium sp. TaxID=1874826 RepID=UPI00352AB8A0
MIWSLLAPLWQAIKAPRVLAGIAGLLIVAGLLIAVSQYRSRVHELEALRKADAASVAKAQIEARAKAYAQKQAVEAKYRAIAERTDHEYQEQLADARTAADRYIAAHRVRSQASQGGSGGPGAAPDDRGAGLPQDLPADAVMVSASDVQACTGAVAYALKARDAFLSAAQASLSKDN